MATTSEHKPDLYPGNTRDTWNEEEESAEDYQPHRRRAKRVDEWMEVEFKFGGSRIKRKTLALVALGWPAPLPLFFMLPALFTVNYGTFSQAVDDVLGTGAEICLFLCLLVTPLAMLTGQRWFIPLRRWYGIMMACNAIGDGVAAGLTDKFSGGFLARLTEHTFVLVGFIMMMLLIPLLITGNPWAQRKLGRYWKPLHRLLYLIWALLFVHLAFLENFTFQASTATVGSGNVGDGDGVFHQRLYQYSACSILLLSLRLPPVKRWIGARQREGRNWLVSLTLMPIFALFVFGMVFIVNELIFKGVDAFNNNPSQE